MKEIKYICDRCKKISNKSDIIELTIYGSNFEKDIRFMKQIEFCIKCFNEFKQEINQ